MFKGSFVNSKEYKKNIIKTKKVFNSFSLDLKNYKIPLLESFDNDYEFDFST